MPFAISERILAKAGPAGRRCPPWIDRRLQDHPLKDWPHLRTNSDGGERTNERLPVADTPIDT